MVKKEIAVVVVAAAVAVLDLGFGPVQEEEEEQWMMRLPEGGENGSSWSRCWEP